MFRWPVSQMKVFGLLSCLFESLLCHNLTNLRWREASLASLLFNHNAHKPGGTLPKYKSGTILISSTRKRAHIIPIVPASSRFSIWWPQKTKRFWGQATTANWVAARHWMRMRKNWHDPMCLLRSTCTYYFFYLKKNRHTWAIVSYNKVEDRERISGKSQPQCKSHFPST